MMQAMTRKTPWMVIVVVLAAALILAACGGSKSGTESDSGSAPAQVEPVANTAQNDAPAAEVDSAVAQPVSDVPGKRDAPAPVDGDYAADTATLVGATGRPQLVEFFTYWCSVCRSIKPTIHTIEAEYWGQVDFVYLDREADANSEVVQQFGIFGQPVLVLLDANGNEVQRWFGAVNGNELRAALDDHLAAS